MRTSFPVDQAGVSTRAFVLFDDAMISMRYARNLSEGYGLVWNPGGERVEGYTNPGWVLLLTVAHGLPISIFKVSLLIQIAGAVFLLLNILATYAVGLWVAPGARLVAFSAALLTAFYYPLNYWGLTGMEVSLCVLVVMSAILLVSRQRYILALLLLGVSTWLRLDMVVVFLAVWFHCLIFLPERRLLMTLAPAMVLVAALGSQTAWRIWYYGDHLPNTYYLKMTGFPAALRVLRGAVHFTYFFLISLWPLLLMAAAIWFIRARSGQWRFPLPRLRQPLSPAIEPVILLAACFLAQAAYSTYVGGDAWERLIACNRFISVVIPAFFILYSLGLYHLAKAISYLHYRGIFTSTVVVSMLNFNSVPRTESLAQWILVEKPTFTQTNAENLHFALAAKVISTREAVVAVDAAGVIPYFVDRSCIDLLGKCDTFVARDRMHRHVMTDNPLLEFYPGHLKWNYEYSIGRLRPDIVMARWGRSKDNSDEFLLPHYTKIQLDGVETWLLKTSPYIRAGTGR